MAQASSRLRTILLSAVALTVMASPQAQAGFEWRGPLAPPPPPAAAPSSAGSDISGLDPVITWDGASSAMPAVGLPPVEQTPVAVPVADAPDLPGDVVEGFGADLPLVIALQQISPAGYRVSFGPGVNPGTIVSWTGGKSWRQVLAETLDSVRLSSKIEDNTIVVMTADKKPEAQSMPEAAKPVVPAVQAGASLPAAASAEVKATPLPPEKHVAESVGQPLPLAAPAPQSSDRVLIGRATETGIRVDSAPAAPVAQADLPPPGASVRPPTVDIRREKPGKPSSLLERLGIHLNNGKEDVRADVKEIPEKALSLPPPSVVGGKSAPAAPVPAAADEQAPPPLPQTPAGAAAAPVEAEAAGVKNNNPAPPVALVPEWRGEKGQTLRAVLKNWSDTAGVDMYWSTDYDFRIERDVLFKGAYDEAVNGLLGDFASARPQPYGKLHQSTGGPRVLVVKVYDAAN